MDKTIYYIKFFNKAIMIVLSVLLALFIYKIFFTQKYSLESKIYLDRNVTLTYYYPGDSTGSGITTGSRLSIGEFSIEEHGWYVYEEAGVEYLVLAAATEKCLEITGTSDACSNYTERLDSITYYSYFDKLVLQIGDLKYNAIVLDSCGRCMTQNKIDIMAVDSSSKNPAALGDAKVIGEEPSNYYNPNVVEQYNYPPTSYSGNLREGYLYEKLYGDKDTSKKTDETIAIDTDKALSDIFKRAETAYNDYEYSNVKVTDIIDSTNGDYLNWKQTDSSWGSIHLGASSETISSAGCAVTSVAIQVKRSGVDTVLPSFNPGTFVQKLSINSGFTNSGAIFWGKVSTVAPKFQYMNQIKLPTNKQQKIALIYTLLEQGYYPVMCVKENCGHWVAVTGVTEDNIYIADPGSRTTQVFPKYDNIASSSTLKVSYYKKID